jgi:hypothetical protein
MNKTIIEYTVSIVISIAASIKIIINKNNNLPTLTILLLSSIIILIYRLKQDGMFRRITQEGGFKNDGYGAAVSSFVILKKLLILVFRRLMMKTP